MQIIIIIINSSRIVIMLIMLGGYIQYSYTYMFKYPRLNLQETTCGFGSCISCG